jgi:hypothetical protein
MPERIYLVSYPKIMFMYPTVVTALFAAVFMWIRGGVPKDEVARGERPAAVKTVLQASLAVQEPAASEKAAPAASDAAAAPTETQAAATDSAASPPSSGTHTYHHVVARIFLLVFALNLVVISFDFPRTTSLTWFFAVVALAIGLWFLFTRYEGLAPAIVSTLLSIKPYANASFYMVFALVMIFLFICVMISRRFDYWEVKGNELLHHHGFLSNLERFSAPNLRIDKEINDLFEYMLLRSGRLIIHASNERRAIVLDNVLFINSKEEKITQMLGALQVRVRTEGP